MKDWTPEERELFEQSRKLKEKARGLVAKRTAAARETAAIIARQQARIARERGEAAKRIAEAERLAQKTRTNERIRRALIKAAQAVTAEGLAFESAPDGTVKFAFTLIDKQYGQIGERYSINTTPTGFQWD